MKILDMNKVKEIREQDIVPILENALNYGHPWNTLTMAALEEITELRRRVVALGGTLPMSQPLDKIEIGRAHV